MSQIHSPGKLLLQAVSCMGTLYQNYLKICCILIHCGLLMSYIYVLYIMQISGWKWFKLGREYMANGLKWLWLDAAWHSRIAAYRSACSCDTCSCNESTRSWQLDGDAALACKDCRALKVQRGKAWNKLAAHVPLQTRQAYFLLRKVQGWETIDHHGP